MRFLTIAEFFDAYKKEVIPAQATPGQLRQLELAFYAGAIITLTTIKELGNPEIPEMVGIFQLEALSQECEQFAKKVNAKQGMTGG